ncbi:SMP-30/gluconolactonase/LRE family protein [Marinomonas atlantica]|uniref:SMP-30/gluconolactonase/LRE family protein n=1 Tax=Marinomonas atlantica TaxID=1806668 RepID=UPI00082CF238|nr:SMP-30/gluconolactonase/LRE family protein [Marinomonas atlantica]MCO4784487.1 SMP-30/gluconolactonase/LRE family protein [Marinomonas atlantica]
MDVQTISSERHRLAEGPFWCDQSDTLYWVDIPTQVIWSWHYGTNSYQKWQMPEKVSAVFVTNIAKTLLVVLATRVASFNTVTETLVDICSLDDDLPNNRGNDAKVAPDGSLWVGTMDDDEEQSSGRLWRITAKGEKKMMLDNVGVSNTLAWDTVLNCMYFADSMTSKIHRYPYPEFSDVRDQKPFAVTLSGSGPDGSAIDDERALWNAQWDGSRIVRYLSDGSIDKTLELPVSRPTSCCFGGPNRRTLFITTASIGLDDQVLKKQPLAGYVIAIELDVTGPSSNPFILS